MRAPAVSFVKRFAAALMAALLSFALLPANALAEGEGDAVSTSAEGVQEVDSSQADGAVGASPEVDDSTSAASLAEGGTLAASLMGRPVSFVNADVVFDGEPVVGSFTVDGLTFAVTEGSDVELVGAAGAEGAFGSEVPTSPQPPSAPTTEAEALPLLLPESVVYNDVDYAVTSIGAYAFYLSGVTSVELPASIVDVDDRAFRSSDVASVEVAEGNLAYSSFDGALYDADQSSLLLIPEGKQGTVLLPKTAESAAPSVFSHCSLVTQVSVEEGSAAFASENGLLYDASLETLLRVPAGATDITIREGCTTIAAGAMEGCAQLATIAAPASVTSISPDVFTSVPTVSLPAAALAEDAPQLTAMVALSSIADAMPYANPERVVVYLGDGAGSTGWERVGFSVVSSDNDNLNDSLSGLSERVTSRASLAYTVYGNGGEIWYRTGSGSAENWVESMYASTWAAGWSVSGNVLRWAGDSSIYLLARCTGYTQIGWGKTSNGSAIANGTTNDKWGSAIYALWRPNTYSIRFDANGGTGSVPNIVSATYDEESVIVAPDLVRAGYVFDGWSLAAGGEKTYPKEGPFKNMTATDKAEVILYAHWERVEYDLGFDVDSEPGDEDYPGIEKPDETVNVESGPTVIEDPKRPGYVFQGWTIPNAEGTEAIDQELVYQDETDGKWYVDASKLPDYAGDDERVELTARWTSVISVDVPSAVTFYADVVTEGQESREGAASSAFGQNKVASQSEVDLRIVGLESSAVETQGSTLGADSILKKAAAAMPSSSTQKLLSLYPTNEALTPDDLQDPDAISATKPTDAVDFALDDILLERSFAADKFTIPAGDTLNLGYRLNLSETGIELDYEKLSTLDEGQSASIANISYCFAADALPSDWGEPLWIENPDQTLNPAKYLLLADIKAAAEDLSANGEASAYYDAYKGMLDRQVMSNGNPGEGPYFQLKVEGAVGDYLDLQLIGICQDTKSDGSGKAGLTFQMRDVYASGGSRSVDAGGGTLNSYMRTSDTNAGGWNSTSVRTTLRSTFWNLLGSDMQASIVSVSKRQQLPGGTTTSYLQRSTSETIWIPSLYEVYGRIAQFNESEALTASGYVPFRYLAYQGSTSSATSARALKTFNGAATFWWTRSANQSTTISFCRVSQRGESGSHGAYINYGLVPAFCL